MKVLPLWHDASVTVEHGIRNRKRAAKLAGASGALESELDELQTTLSSALTEFEALIDECVDGVPDWANVDREELRELYFTTIADQRVSIGPRAAAIAAARVETFVRAWVSGDDDGRPASFDDGAAASWGEELDALGALIESVAEQGREAARVADERLSTRLDEVLAQIEEKRESGESGVDPQLDALRRKLRTGKVGAALLKRQSEADLLEEQRRKSEELREAWAGLEQLAFAGAEMSVDGSERLRGVLESTIEAVVAAYPELASVAEGWVEVNQPIRKRQFNAPPPLPAEDREGSPSSVADVDDAHRVTEPIAPTRTEEYARELVSEDAPELSGPRVRFDTDPPRTAQDTPLAPAGATATMEVSVALEEFQEPAFRVTTTWQPVPYSEVALVLAPPAVYTVFITGAALLYQLGLWSENPFRLWPWALPSFGAFALWALGLPAILNWRVEWDGRVPRPMRLSERRQEGFADIDAVAARIDGHRFDFAVTEATLDRWRSPSGRGWTLTLTDDGGASTMFASEATSARWQDSNAPCDPEEPLGCWRVSEEALLQLADRCA